MALLRNIGVVLFIIWGCFSFSPVANSNHQTVYPGVFVNGIPLGGKNINAVYRILEEENKKVGKCKIFLHLPDSDTVKEVSFTAMGIGVDKRKIWQEVSAQGRSGSWLEKFKVRWCLKRKGVNLPLYLILDQVVAANILEEVGQPWCVEAKDAQFKITSRDQVLILPEEVGEKVAVKAALLSLQQKLLMNSGDNFHLYLSLEKITPNKVRQDLEGYGISGQLSKFSTQFNSAKVKRTNNIRLAVQELDLFLLPPGEIFSFNEVVGPRTRERGYDEADIIQNYNVVSGLGGGVCQVSSTLYNAVLLADLEVVERYPHSKVINYVQPGLDATVVYGSRDFKFRNNSKKYLLIKALVYQGTVICKIFGQSEKKRKVVIKTFLERLIQPTTIYQEDSLVPEGKYILEREGIPGRVIRVERYVYEQGGKLIKKEVLSKDFYPPVDKIIRSSTEPQSLSVSGIL